MADLTGMDWVADFEAKLAAERFYPELNQTLFAEWECELCGRLVNWLDTRSVTVDGEPIRVCPECREALNGPAPRALREQQQAIIGRLVWWALIAVTVLGSIWWLLAASGG